MNPFPYQQQSINEINEKFETCSRVLLQAHTGYGKTVIFSHLTDQYVKQGKKVLILCHRSELIDQTQKTLEKIGVKSQSIVPETKRIHQFVDVYVAMVETVNNRLKKGKINIKDIDLVIADECHVLVFDKVFKYFPHAKILGVTATPIVLKNIKYYKCRYCKTESNEHDECCNEEMEEWRKPFAMSNIYDDIVVGADIKHLIDFGQLVPEISFTKKYTDNSTLKVDSRGDFTSQSLDETYGTDDAAFNVLLNYKEICKGKRTIIFNSSTKSNLIVYQKFKEAGLNVRLFDSVNVEESGSRKELVEWFRNTPDAILCNVGVFVAGFDCKEVEAIIINRATLSLSMFLQMAGRGGRSSVMIYKDSFILIDGGDNIERFGEWSSERDWKDIFVNGIGKPRPKKLDPIDIQDCPSCGALFPKVESVCPFCNEEIQPPEIKPPKTILESNIVVEPIREIPPPNARKIYEYTLSQGQDIHFSFKVMYSRILDMFIYYRVTLPMYEKAKENGELDKKLRKFIHPCYFLFIKQKDIQNTTNRTLNYVITKAKEKIEKYYYGR